MRQCPAVFVWMVTLVLSAHCLCAAATADPFTGRGTEAPDAASAPAEHASGPVAVVGCALLVFNREANRLISQHLRAIRDGDALWPLLGAYRGLSFALPSFVPEGLDGPRLQVVPGAFDPLRASRLRPRGPLPDGLDPSRPLVCHIGRLDAWADPLAAVEAWRLARREQPGLQLAIAGRVDPSDAEAAAILEEIADFAAGEDDLHLLTDRTGASPEGIDAVATLARCAMRCSVGDEFDPEVSASQWRGTPVVGEGGFLAAGAEAQAVRIAALVGGPRRALQVARAGRERVSRDFSIVRLLGDELGLLERLLSGNGDSAGQRRPAGPGRVGASA